MGAARRVGRARPLHGEGRWAGGSRNERRYQAVVQEVPLRLKPEGLVKEPP